MWAVSFYADRLDRDSAIVLSYAAQLRTPGQSQGHGID